METNHISYLRCVSKHQNISAAARELGMTQPALTKIVSRVEDLFGAKIFDRGPRGVTLTPLGTLFLERMEVIEQELNNLSKEFVARKSGLSGTVSVGVGQFWIGRVLPRVIARLSQLSPDIQVKITTGTRDSLLENLRKGSIDIVLGRLTGGLPDGLRGEALTQMRLYVVARRDHPLAGLDRSATIGELSEFGWVLPPAGDPTIQFAFTEQGMVPPVTRVEAFSQNLVFGLLQATDFVSIIPELPVNELALGLTRIRADWLKWSSDAGAISVAGRSMLPCTEKFLAVLQEEVRGPSPAPLKSAKA